MLDAKQLKRQQEAILSCMHRTVKSLLTPMQYETSIKHTHARPPTACKNLLACDSAQAQACPEKLTGSVCQHLWQYSLQGHDLGLLALQGAVVLLQQGVQADQEVLGSPLGRAGRRPCRCWSLPAWSHKDVSLTVMSEAASACRCSSGHSSFRSKLFGALGDLDRQVARSQGYQGRNPLQHLTPIVYARKS